MSKLPSGTYIIKNLKYKNFAAIRNDDDGSPLVAAATSTGKASNVELKYTWRVDLLSNDKYNITNVQYPDVDVVMSRNDEPSVESRRLPHDLVPWTIELEGGDLGYTIKDGQGRYAWSLTNGDLSALIRLQPPVIENNAQRWIFDGGPTKYPSGGIPKSYLSGTASPFDPGAEVAMFDFQSHLEANAKLDVIAILPIRNVLNRRSVTAHLARIASEIGRLAQDALIVPDMRLGAISYAKPDQDWLINVLPTRPPEELQGERDKPEDPTRHPQCTIIDILNKALKLDVREDAAKVIILAPSFVTWFHEYDSESTDADTLIAKLKEMKIVLVADLEEIRSQPFFRTFTSGSRDHAVCLPEALSISWISTSTFRKNSVEDLMGIFSTPTNVVNMLDMKLFDRTLSSTEQRNGTPSKAKRVQTGTYVIRSSRHPSAVALVADKARSPAVSVDIPRQGSAHRWNILAQNDGSYSIENFSHNDFSHNDFAGIAHESRSVEVTQNMYQPGTRWHVVQMPGKHDFLIKTIGGDLCWSLPNQNLPAPIELGSPSSAITCRWILEPTHNSLPQIFNDNAISTVFGFPPPFRRIENLDILVIRAAGILKHPERILSQVAETGLSKSGYSLRVGGIWYTSAGKHNSSIWDLAPPECWRRRENSSPINSFEAAVKEALSVKWRADAVKLIVFAPRVPPSSTGNRDEDTEIIAKMKSQGILLAVMADEEVSQKRISGTSLLKTLKSQAFVGESSPIFKSETFAKLLDVRPPDEESKSPTLLGSLYLVIFGRSVDIVDGSGQRATIVETSLDSRRTFQDATSVGQDPENPAYATVEEVPTAVEQLDGDALDLELDLWAMFVWLVMGVVIFCVSLKTRNAK